MTRRTGRKRRIPGKRVLETKEKDSGNNLQRLGTDSNTWYRSPFVVILFLAILTIITYKDTFSNGFIWDDPEYVLKNKTLVEENGLYRIWFERGATPQYYPLVFTGFRLEHALWGFDATGYHVVNTVLHGLAGVLLFFVLRRLAVPAAWLVAAFFVVHPVQVESVAWITERKNVLSLVFYLGAAWAYLCFPPDTDSESEPIKVEDVAERSRTRGSWWAYWAAFALFFCALLSKTVTATLPAALLLVLWWKKPRIGWRDVMPLVPFFALGIALSMNTAWMEATHVGAQGDAWSLTWYERILLAGRIPWFYVGKLLWPSTLIFIYPRWEISAADPLAYLGPFALVIVLSGLFFARRRLGKGPFTGAAFFVGSLVPALGFFNVYPMRFSYVADHFQYLATPGFIALCVAGGWWGLGLWKNGRSVAVHTMVPLLLLVLLLMSRDQGKIYIHQMSLWEDTIRKNSAAWIAHSNLAEIRVTQAEAYLAQAEIRKARGEVQRAQTMNQEAQRKINSAIHHCNEALRVKKDLPEAQGNLANALFRSQRFAEAEDYYRKVLRREPGNVKARNNLGALLNETERRDEAVECFEALLKEHPDYASAHYNLANTYRAMGNRKKAIRHYEETLRLNPNFTEARARLEGLRK